MKDSCRRRRIHILIPRTSRRGKGVAWERG